MKLNTYEIRRFLTNSNAIKSNGLIPVLDYIKIEDDKIIKTNSYSWVVMDITPIGDTLLLEERVLSAFVKGTTKDEIKVEVKGDRVYLSDGVSKSYFTLSDERNFPKFPESEKEDGFYLNESVLKSIGVASKNISTTKLKSSFDYVHLSDNYVFGTDNNRFYFKKFDNLPDISIDAECAGIISQFGGATYFNKGNYNFFEVGTTLYGFIKPETTIPPFQRLMGTVLKEPYMEFKTSDLLGFIDFATASSPSQNLYCTMKGNMLTFSDEDYNVGDERQVETVGSYEVDLNFSPKIFYPFFRSLGKEKIRISPLDGKPFGVAVWDENDTDFTGIIGGLAPETLR